MSPDAFVIAATFAIILLRCPLYSVCSIGVLSSKKGKDDLQWASLILFSFHAIITAVLIGGSGNNLVHRRRDEGVIVDADVVGPLYSRGSAKVSRSTVK
jgi:hypothetical protein